VAQSVLVLGLETAEPLQELAEPVRLAVAELPAQAALAVAAAAVAQLGLRLAPMSLLPVLGPGHRLDLW
jgi:hypothetical protein